MKVRKAELADLPRMVEIEGLCFPEETAFPPGMFAYLIRYAISLVACEPEDKAVGFIVGYVSGREGAIYTLDIHPLFRRRGIGGRLINAVEQELKALGAKSIRLEAAAENEEALKLYHQAGYIESEFLPNYYGRGKNALRLRKNLGSRSG